MCVVVYVLCVVRVSCILCVVCMCVCVYVCVCMCVCMYVCVYVCVSPTYVVTIGCMPDNTNATVTLVKVRTYSYCFSH